MIRREISIPLDGEPLAGTLACPHAGAALVIFAHGSGSSRNSPRNEQVARALNDAGLGTLLFDLLTQEEERADRYTGHLRFDIELLAGRLMRATDWAFAHSTTRSSPLGYFGASTGGAAALIAAARFGERIGAVVSRGGRPDLAAGALAHVRAPTLLIVGERDETVVGLNRIAYSRLRGTRELAIVGGATHLFEEPGALERVAELAIAWFRQHLVMQDSGGNWDENRIRGHPAA